jgi:hypothetical protein
LLANATVLKQNTTAIRTTHAKRASDPRVPAKFPRLVFNVNADRPVFILLIAEKRAIWLPICAEKPASNKESVGNCAGLIRSRFQTDHRISAQAQRCRSGFNGRWGLIDLTLAIRIIYIMEHS